MHAHTHTQMRARERDIGIFIHTERLNQNQDKKQCTHRLKKDFTIHLELITTKLQVKSVTY